MARVANLVSAVVILLDTEWALANMGSVTFLLIGDIGATALVGPLALSLFWRETSNAGSLAGVIASQVNHGLSRSGTPGPACTPTWSSIGSWSSDTWSRRRSPPPSAPSTPTTSSSRRPPGSPPVAEFALASVVVYWSVTHGFEDEGVAEAETIPPEDRGYTRTSPVTWGGFVAAIVPMIVVGA